MTNTMSSASQEKAAAAVEHRDDLVSRLDQASQGLGEWAGRTLLARATEISRLSAELAWAQAAVNDYLDRGYLDDVRYCAICGEPYGSPYAKHCCTDDQMIGE